jgi:hypothetical protein
VEERQPSCAALTKDEMKRAQSAHDATSLQNPFGLAAKYSAPAPAPAKPAAPVVALPTHAGQPHAPYQPPLPVMPPPPVPQSVNPDIYRNYGCMRSLSGSHLDPQLFADGHHAPSFIPQPPPGFQPQPPPLAMQQAAYPQVAPFAGQAGPFVHGAGPPQKRRAPPTPYRRHSLIFCSALRQSCRPDGCDLIYHCQPAAQCRFSAATLQPWAATGRNASRAASSRPPDSTCWTTRPHSATSPSRSQYFPHVRSSTAPAVEWLS